MNLVQASQFGKSAGNISRRLWKLVEGRNGDYEQDSREKAISYSRFPRGLVLESTRSPR